MEVVVDQSWHDDVVVGANDFGVGMLAAEFPIVTHRFDQSVPLEHRPVGDNVRRSGAGNLADDVLAPYQR